MTCTFKDCKNNEFPPYRECALHCVKKSYQDDNHKGVLSEFYDLLRIYIAEFIRSIPSNPFLGAQDILNSPAKSFRLGSNLDIAEMIRSDDLSDYEVKDLIRKYNKEDEIVLSNINFPYRDNRDDYDYFKLLELFNGVHLLDCHLYLGDWRLEDVSFFFQGCKFYNWFDITPIRMLSNDNNCLFSECEFKTKVRLSPTELYSIFEDYLFSGCIFRDLLRLENVTFEKEPFLDIDERELKLSTLEIYNCNFNGGLKLNNMRISYLWIESTNFLIGLWILKASISTFNCINVVMDGLFDASGSSFGRAKFNRTKFLDVADFEGVNFGKFNGEYLESDGHITIFKYVTFMTASNFKNTYFFYSLDFENVDLREQPNFLKSYVNSYNTNRETFRIIKNSFDSRGNTLEANRFFVLEMKAFKQELKEEGSYWDKIVYNMNDFLSEFGANYIRPIVILLVSIVLYTIIDYFHKDYFSSHDYFVSGSLEPFWEFLNDLAKNFLPFSKFLAKKDGLEFISLLFYIWFAVLIWQIIVSIKRHTQR